MQPVRSKGTNIHGVLGAVLRMDGEEAHARVVEAIAGEAGDAFRHGSVVSSGWYPVAWHDAVLAAVEAGFPGRRFAIREHTREAAKYDFNTIFKFTRLVASPSLALPISVKVMSRYYDGGHVSIPDVSEGLVHFRFERYHGFTPRIWEDLVGGIEGVFELMHLRLLPFEIRGARGADAEIIARYERGEARDGAAV